jgi:very-short-patch-repair endonuclease
VNDVLPKGYTLLIGDDEWKQQCTGIHFCPPIRCDAHPDLPPVTTTQINSLQQGQGVGCPKCRNKTEAILKEFLERRFPEATVTHNTFKGPFLKGQTHFDFHLRFGGDGRRDEAAASAAAADVEVLVELDGAQHFWADEHHFTQENCERDLAKEEWALARGASVVRVLQEDVWADRLDWRGWVARSVRRAVETVETVEAATEATEATGGSGGARVFVPPAAREYTARESGYAALRA